MNMHYNLPTISEILSKANVQYAEGCYIYGSRVYGTSDIESDWDILLISNEVTEETEISDDRLDIHVIPSSTFKDWVGINSIKAIECLFAPKWAILKDFKCVFYFNESGYRHEISKTASNSWVKAKKKIEQGDYKIGIKSAFHCIRIVDFGIQLSENGYIDFNSCDDIWDDLMSKKWSYDELKIKYKPIYNRKMSRFRELCKK